MFTCPVCFYDQLDEAPRNYNICECCGTEFGNDDCGMSHDQLRERWLSEGAPWFFGFPPALWNPWQQVLKANVGFLPYSTSSNFSGGDVEDVKVIKLDDIPLACAA